jgi:hypothetical protein
MHLPPSYRYRPGRVGGLDVLHLDQPVRIIGPVGCQTRRVHWRTSGVPHSDFPIDGTTGTHLNQGREFELGGLSRRGQHDRESGQLSPTPHVCRVAV